MATRVAGNDGFRSHFRGRARAAHAADVPFLLATAVVALSVLVLGSASPVRAEPLPVQRDVSVGLPPRRVQVRVERIDQGTRIRARAGTHTSEVTLPRALVDAEVEQVGLARGASVAVVRGRDETGRVAALVAMRAGRPEVVWSGRLDPHGDPGERTADVLELSDRTGDGEVDVVIAQTREGVGLCGQPPALLYPRALDPASGELRPVVLRRIGEGAEVAVQASATSPGPEGAPVVRALRAVGASSALGVDENAVALAPPHALTDGRAETYWAEGRGGPGEQELVTLRFGAGMPIRALAVTPARADGVRAPRELWIVGDAGPRLRVTLPESGEGRAWIVPPEPLEWSCFSVVLADSGAEAGARTGIAEIEAYTELDFGAGVDGLVAELVRESEGADRATEWLARLGERGVQALEGAWDRLSPRGRERATRVALGPARAGSAAALALLERAAGDERAEVRGAGLAALARAGAELQIAAVAAQSGEAGEDAAALLARSERPFALEPLLGALAAEGGSERPRLRAAIARGVALGGEEAAAAIEAAELPLAAQASLALGLAEDAATRALAGPLVTRAILAATEFPDRYRLALAAHHLADLDRESAAQLGAWAREADEWMLRRAAVLALGASSLDVLRERATEDPYPRVRIAAIERLAELEALEAGSPVLATAARDRWPMVRAAALDVAARQGMLTAVRAALDDDAQMVRRRAVEHLTRLRDRESWPAIEARLLDADEWPSVVEAALGYVSELCVAEAGDALIAVIRRGARQGAWEPFVQNAVAAIGVARRLGGPVVEEARQVALRGGEALRAAADAPGETEPGCRSGSPP